MQGVGQHPLASTPILLVGHHTAPPSYWSVATQHPPSYWSVTTQHPHPISSVTTQHPPSYWSVITQHPHPSYWGAQQHTQHTHPLGEPIGELTFRGSLSPPPSPFGGLPSGSGGSAFGP